MKKYINISNRWILPVICLAFVLNACHELEQPITTELTPQNFPTKPEHFVQLGGVVYSQFRNDYAIPYWFLQTLTTDEAILPARGGNWLDAGRYQQEHLHTWNKDHAHVTGAWDWLTSTISFANQTLYFFSQAPESTDKAASIAEMRTMRAVCYYMMMDLYGNIPIVSDFGDATKAVVTTPRAQVFQYIENELKESLDNLTTDVTMQSYGRPNKYTAYALLAKMYLNAEVYTGTARWADAVEMCDQVMKSGKYEYTLSYKAMFNINNGPQIKEFIFTIPFDASTSTGWQFFARYSLHKTMRSKYSLPFTPSGAISVMPGYYAYYDDPADVRNQMWLTGKQYDYKGNALTVKTTKKGYDEDYTGSDGDAEYIYHVDLTPDVILKNAAAFDAGNDEKSWAEGYRCNKYYPDSTSTSRNQGNDVPIFRYSDIVLMKAEAILRGAAPTEGQTALSLVNGLRTVRKASAFASVTLEDIYAERCRELAWEAWHRNDMIRFGKFENSWGYKTDTDVRKRIFPIPKSAMELNPGLTQNEGY